jgi:hypothetical protein
LSEEINLLRFESFLCRLRFLDCLQRRLLLNGLCSLRLVNRLSRLLLYWSNVHRWSKDWRRWGNNWWSWFRRSYTDRCGSWRRNSRRTYPDWRRRKGSG